MSHTYNTEIVYGLDVIIKRTLKRLSNANKKIDACISGVALEGTVKAKPIFDMILLSKKKGVKIRYITDYQTKSSVCKRINEDRGVSTYG
jgi:hypothetical protein